jgi:Xaa-Pro aminopeptidase
VITAQREEAKVSSLLFLIMNLEPPLHPFQDRQAKLRSQLEQRNLPLLVVTNPRNIFYLMGFRGSAGVAALGVSESILWVDPRYTLQARDESRHVEVLEERGSLLKAVAQWLRKKKFKRVGFEDAQVTYGEYRALEKESGGKIRFEPASGIIEGIRFVKDEGEIAQIRAACQISVEAFTEVRPLIRPGARESDLAAEIEFRMRRKGAEGPSFDTIVASGPRGALPHARASGKLLGKSELVIFDLGAILNGYAADMTRTVFLGPKPGRRIKSLYKAVLEAQQRAVESIRDGVESGKVDAAAREALSARGLANYFTHSTGHGVGLDIHERPRLGRNDKTRLQTGCVVTAEPGIYIEGLGGIRLEDTVLAGQDGPEILTSAPMDDWIIS